MKVEFYTHEYERAHGKMPRGRGGWAFCPVDKYKRADYLDHVFWASGLYREARALAKAHFGLVGVSEVVVCS